MRDAAFWFYLFDSYFQLLIFVRDLLKVSFASWFLIPFFSGRWRTGWAVCGGIFWGSGRSSVRLWRFDRSIGRIEFAIWFLCSFITIWGQILAGELYPWLSDSSEDWPLELFILIPFIQAIFASLTVIWILDIYIVDLQ